MRKLKLVDAAVRIEAEQPIACDVPKVRIRKIFRDLERVAFYLIQSFLLNDEAAFAMADAFGVQDEFD